MEFKTLLTSAAIVALSAGFASAQDDATLSVDGEVIKTRADAPAFAENLDTVYSGWHFRSGETQVLQMDDFENPAFVFLARWLSFGLRCTARARALRCRGWQRTRTL